MLNKVKSTLKSLLKFNNALIDDTSNMFQKLGTSKDVGDMLVMFGAAAATPILLVTGLAFTKAGLALCGAFMIDAAILGIGSTMGAISVVACAGVVTLLGLGALAVSACAFVASAQALGRLTANAVVMQPDAKDAAPAAGKTFDPPSPAPDFATAVNGVEVTAKADFPAPQKGPTA